MSEKESVFEAIRLDDRKRVEPVRRLCAGRHGFVIHRFPIKGGITPTEALDILIGELLDKQRKRIGFASRFLAITKEREGT